MSFKKNIVHKIIIIINWKAKIFMWWEFTFPSLLTQPYLYVKQSTLPHPYPPTTPDPPQNLDWAHIYTALVCSGWFWSITIEAWAKSWTDQRSPQISTSMKGLKIRAPSCTTLARFSVLLRNINKNFLFYLSVLWIRIHFDPCPFLPETYLKTDPDRIQMLPLP